MQMKTATILTVLWSFCWMIQGIAGIPVPSLEMRQSQKFGPPLTANEFNCIPKFSKSETHHSNSLGNDVRPSDGKNAYLGYKWPNASAIPYEIDSAFDAKERCAIGNALNAFQKNTCIRFVPYKNEIGYMRINKLNRTDWSCSVNAVGYTRGAHAASFTPSCFTSETGSAQHEFMHILGFRHEQQRPDRDHYVEMIWANIAENMKSAYNLANDTQLILSYDYGSMMHYGLGSQMKTKQNLKNARIDKRYGLSKLDIMKINRMYCKL